MEAALSPPPQQYPIDANDYCAEFATHMSEAWDLAQKHIEKAQKHQKKHHDKHSQVVDFSPGDQVLHTCPLLDLVQHGS